MSNAVNMVAVGVLGDIAASLQGIGLKATPQTHVPFAAVRRAIVEDRQAFANDTGFPVKPQLGDTRVRSTLRHRSVSW